MDIVPFVRRGTSSLGAGLFLGFWVSWAAAAVPVPDFESPISGGAGVPFVAATTFDLAQVGYVQQEFFVAGTASAYTNAGGLGLDGLWAVTPGDTAVYKTRILLHRPIDGKRFNGTVVVEWLNVSGGLDAAPDWILGHTEFIREGYAWVGVSVQRVGVEGGTPLVPGLPVLPLKSVDAVRYASLAHPGDSFSYDIFSQVGQLVRQPAGPLGELKVKRVIAAGESQSAFRMVTYINAVHPLAKMFDGYFVHSRGAFGADLAEAPQAQIATPGAVKIRLDLGVPVLTLQTETDMTFLQYFAARQDDSPNFRLWEVAGTAHADTYTVEGGMTDLGTDPNIVGLVFTSAPLGGIFTCLSPFNSGPHHFVVKAAFAALDRWVRTGKAPKSAPRFETSGPPTAFVLDRHGNVKGGVRTPQVDVPIATFTGTQAGTILCALFGTTTPFDPAKLATLYPTHARFVAAYNKATSRAVKRGWVRRADGKLMKRWAATAPIGG